MLKGWRIASSKGHSQHFAVEFCVQQRNAGSGLKMRLDEKAYYVHVAVTLYYVYTTPETLQPVQGAGTV